MVDGSIAQNLTRVWKRTEAAASRSGRTQKDICLVAVSKTATASEVEEAIKAGVTDVGENTAQEFLRKHQAIGSRVKWHFVGHLQRNKVKYVVGLADLIHSLDSLALAKEINKRAQTLGIIQKVLVEVNVSGEESKFGIMPGDLEEFIRESASLENLAVKGLMTMAPFVAAEKARPVFGSLRKLLNEIKKTFPQHDMKWLSMGMTNDFEVAIEEGSNMVRIGRAIFEN